MIKNFLLPIFLLFSLLSIAQQGTSSPYSFYGIGDIRFKGTNETKAIGGVSIFADSIHINLQNPASYSILKFTSLTVGSTSSYSKFNAASGDGKAQKTTLDYLAVGIPMGKFGGAFGLVPYSSVGYKIKTVKDSTDGSQMARRYTGTGGLNKVFAGLSYQVNPNLSIGADFNYSFGKITTNNIKDLSTAQYGTQETNTSELSGISFNIGAMYNKKINKKLDFYSGITFTPKSNLNSSNQRSVFSVIYAGDATPQPVDYLDTISSRTTIKLPSKLAIGIGLGEKKKWAFGSEVTFQQSSSFGNRFSDIKNSNFENAVKYSLGGFYIPNYTSFSSYFKKVTYRAGFRYENTGLVIDNERIKDYAFTGGLGLPLGGTLSNLNLGMEVGRRGTAKANLVEENYINVIISISLNDKWFVKTRYQ